ncbi:MAG: hypothetical protein ABR529_11890 [Actinomycetota bacterium]
MSETRSLSDEDIRTIWAQEDRATEPAAKADDDDDDDAVDTDTKDTTDTDDDGDDA